MLILGMVGRWVGKNLLSLLLIVAVLVAAGVQVFLYFVIAPLAARCAPITVLAGVSGHLDGVAELLHGDTDRLRIPGFGIAGALGIVDYYRMKNLQADTDMRNKIADAGEHPPTKLGK